MKQDLGSSLPPLSVHPGRICFKERVIIGANYTAGRANLYNAHLYESFLFWQNHFYLFFYNFFPPFQDLRQYLSSLAEQCSSEETDTELPTVVILDNLHHIGSLSDIFNGFLNCKYHKW